MRHTFELGQLVHHIQKWVRSFVESASITLGRITGVIHYAGLILDRPEAASAYFDCLHVPAGEAAKSLNF